MVARELIKSTKLNSVFEGEDNLSKKSGVQLENIDKVNELMSVIENWLEKYDISRK